MENFNIFKEKFIIFISHIVAVITSIITFLSFFGIDYKKLKLIIIQKKYEVIDFVYKVEESFIYRVSRLKIKLLNIYFYTVKTIAYYIYMLLCKFMISLSPDTISCLLLTAIVIIELNSTIYLYKESNVETLFLSQNIVYSDVDYATSNSTENQHYTKTFIDKPEKIPEIYSTNIFNDDELDQLFNLLFYINEDDLNEKIENNIKIWLSNCLQNTSLNGAVTEAGKSAAYYSEKECVLFKEGYSLLESELLDEIINGRLELIEKYPNGTLAWLLANNYLMYALDYIRETENEEYILFFCMKSIEYAQKSLEFDMDYSSKIIRIKFIQTRYKDIANCNAIHKDIRKKANNIYMLIENLLNNGISQ